MDWRKNPEVVKGVRIANAIESGAWVVTIGLIAIAFVLASGIDKLILGVIGAVMIAGIVKSKEKELRWYELKEFEKDFPGEEED